MANQIDRSGHQARGVHALAFSGFVALVASGLALFASAVLEPPKANAIVAWAASLGGIVIVFLATWAIRLWRVGKIPKKGNRQGLIAPEFASGAILFFKMWLGFGAAIFVLLISLIMARATGFATGVITRAFQYVLCISPLVRGIAGTLGNLAILRTASNKSGLSGD